MENEVGNVFHNKEEEENEVGGLDWEEAELVSSILCCCCCCRATCYNCCFRVAMEYCLQYRFGKGIGGIS